jgi:hypothetical protein
MWTVRFRLNPRLEMKKKCYQEMLGDAEAAPAASPGRIQG